MDAVAIYSYQSEDPDVFSLNVGDELIIVPINEDWCRAKLRGQEAFAPLAYLKVERHPWFKGSITRELAEFILLEKGLNGEYIHPDGAFLIRDNAKTPGFFSISVKWENSIQFYRIYNNDDKFTIWDHEGGFTSFNKLINYHYSHSINPKKTIMLKDLNLNIYRAKRNFTSQDATELSFRIGDRLRILDNSDQNWWQAEMNNQIGLVPAQFLEFCE